MRVLVSLVEKDINDILFLVEIDYTYIQVAIPRVRWLRPLGYEINVDEASAAITALLAEEMDKEAKAFGTYDIVKSRVEIDLKMASTLKKKDKMVKKLKVRFGEGDEEEDKEEEEVEEQGPLAITQGLGDEKEEEAAKAEEKEEVEQAPKDNKKRKAKSQPIAKPIQAECPH